MSEAIIFPHLGIELKHVGRADGVRYYLAESHEVSDDGLTITVKLRDNLKWHDGESITTDDVLWNFEFRMNPDNKSSSGTKVNQKPVTVEKIDELTFSVKLPEVSASYVATLGSMKLIPKHVYEGEENIASSALNTTQGVGSGPYKVKEWKKGESLTLEKFDDYYRDVNLDTVIFKIMPNESAQEIAFENGELNIIRVSTIDKYEKYAANDNYEMVTLDEGRINYMGFNSNSELMKNIEARKAIATALDVPAIVEGAYGSDDIAVPAKTVFCDQNFYYEDIDGYKHDLEEAKKLVKEAGLEGKTLQLTGNIFGKEIEGSIPVKMEKAEVDKLLKTKNKGSQIVLDVDGQKMHVLIKEVDYNTLKKQVDEVDFQALVSGEKVHSVAEVVLLNHEMVMEGVLEPVLTEIAYKAVPEALVEKVEIDVANMKPGESVKVKDLPIASNKDIDLMTDLEMTVVTVLEAHNAAVDDTEEETVEEA